MDELRCDKAWNTRKGKMPSSPNPHEHLESLDRLLRKTKSTGDEHGLVRVVEHVIMVMDYAEVFFGSGTQGLTRLRIRSSATTRSNPVWRNGVIV